MLKMGQRVITFYGFYHTKTKTKTETKNEKVIIHMIQVPNVSRHEKLFCSREMKDLVR